jgi:hypothetical protein
MGGAMAFFVFITYDGKFLDDVSPGQKKTDWIRYKMRILLFLSGLLPDFLLLVL